MTTAYTQLATASDTVLHDWTARLAKAEKDLGLTAGTLKLSAPTVTCPTNITAASVVANGSGTGVQFKLSTTLTAPVFEKLLVSVSLSNGDSDAEYFLVNFV